MKEFLKPNKFKIIIMIVLILWFFFDPIKNQFVDLILNLPMYLLTMNQVGYDAPRGASIFVLIPSLLLYWYLLSSIIFDIFLKFRKKKNHSIRK